MNVVDRIWSRLRGKEPDPTIGTQIGLVAGAVAVNEAAQGGETADYGWSGDHVSGESDFGGGAGFDGGGDAGGGGVSSA